jgi:2-haloacid dehalogenase
VISEEVGAAKPHKKIFDIAFEKMDSPRKKDVLIIGDSLSSDIQGGNNYGIDSCWFNARRRPRDGDVEIQHEIKDLRELLDLVGLA